jgi:hypothetical protein
LQLGRINFNKRWLNTLQNFVPESKNEGEDGINDDQEDEDDELELLEQDGEDEEDAGYSIHNRKEFNNFNMFDGNSTINFNRNQKRIIMHIDMVIYKW